MTEGNELKKRCLARQLLVLVREGAEAAAETFQIEQGRVVRRSVGLQDLMRLAASDPSTLAGLSFLGFHWSCDTTSAARSCAIASVPVALLICISTNAYLGPASFVGCALGIVGYKSLW